MPTDVPPSAPSINPAATPASLADTAAAALPPPITPAPIIPGAPELAGRVFAAAIHLAVARDERRLPRADAPALASAPISGATLDPARAQAGSAPAIDLTDRHWPAQMVERIEALRDGADATSTRVRFAPDALGPVELHVRHDGDQVHLHFTAADPATRTLLGDARPELARLASERGVRLGDTSVGPGDGQSRRQPAAPARFTAPPRLTLADTTDAPTDTRIA